MLGLKFSDPHHSDEHASKKSRQAQANQEDANTAYYIIVTEHEALKVEITTLIEACSLLKLWLELHIPRIEDGNNFGVSVKVH